MQPTLKFLELHLLMAHYYNSTKWADSGEDMVCHQKLQHVTDGMFFHLRGKFSCYSSGATMLITTHCLHQVQLCPFGKTAITQQQCFWHSVSYAQLETVNAHDQALVEWQNTWPSDLRLDEFGIAYAMSHNVSKDMVWHGMQCMYLYGLSLCWSLQSSLLTCIRSLSGLFNLTRLCLNCPTAITMKLLQHMTEWLVQQLN